MKGTVKTNGWVDHILEGEACWCNPTTLRYPEGDLTIHHNPALLLFSPACNPILNVPAGMLRPTYPITGKRPEQEK